MRVVFHEEFLRSDYSEDPYDNAADEGRLVPAMTALQEEGFYTLVEPESANLTDLLRGHSEAWVDRVGTNPRLYRAASLSVGACLLAADFAMRGEPMFAAVRPPGHHASRGSAWGHCTFSNLALALLKLRDEGRIRSACVVDFDLHTGDGTIDVLRSWPEAHIINVYGDTAPQYLADLQARLAEAPDADVLAVSAGFDAHLHDLGRKLATEDYFTVGRLLQAHAIRLRHQRRFAVLEGGYNPRSLGRSVLAFCRGFE